MKTEYLRPKHMDEVLRILQVRGSHAHILAGGTDLLVHLRQASYQPECLVDITALDELRRIRRDDEMVYLGALVTHRQVERDPRLANYAGVLVNACHQVGSVQIRNYGTLGGNLVNASPAGDAILALAVLDAEILLHAAGGERWLPLSEFITGPGITTRCPDELLTTIRFQRLPASACCFFHKVGQRRSVTIAKVSISGMIFLAEGVIQECRIALGAVAPTVLRLPSVERFLCGSSINEQVIQQAADLAADSCAPIDDIRSTVEYRRHMVRVLARRCLQAALGVS